MKRFLIFALLMPPLSFAILCTLKGRLIVLSLFGESWEDAPFFYVVAFILSLLACFMDSVCSRTGASRLLLPMLSAAVYACLFGLLGPIEAPIAGAAAAAACSWLAREKKTNPAQPIVQELPVETGPIRTYRGEVSKTN